MPEVIQFTPTKTSAPNPLRQFAREAVAAIAPDRLQAVLRWRFAQRVSDLTRERFGLPLCSLEQLAPRERTWCYAQAAALVALAESIHTSAPPTDGELRVVDAQQALALVQAKVRCAAVSNGHELRGWRPAEKAGYEENLCEPCGAGASIHVATTEVSVSDELRASCPQRRPR